ADAERSDRERAGVGRGGDTLLARLRVDHSYRGLADDSAGGIGDDAGDHAHVLLREQGRSDKGAEEEKADHKLVAAIISRVRVCARPARSQLLDQRGTILSKSFAGEGVSGSPNPIEHQPVEIPSQLRGGRIVDKVVQLERIVQIVVEEPTPVFGYCIRM